MQLFKMNCENNVTPESNRLVHTDNLNFLFIHGKVKMYQISMLELD